MIRGPELNQMIRGPELNQMIRGPELNQMICAPRSRTDSNDSRSVLNALLNTPIVPETKTRFILFVYYLYCVSLF